MHTLAQPFCATLAILAQLKDCKMDLRLAMLTSMFNRTTVTDRGIDMEFGTGEANISLL